MMLATVTEMITAIAGLWKLVLVCAILVGIVIFRKPIGEFLSNLKNFRFKKGNTEVAVERGISEKPAESRREGEAEPPPGPEEPEPAKEPSPRTSSSHFAEMQEAFLEGKLKEAEENFTRLQETEEDPGTKLTNEALYLYLRYEHANDATAVEKLEELSKNEKVRGEALFWVAACHERSRSYQKAIDAYKLSLSTKLKDNDVAIHTVAMAKCLVKIEKEATALQELSACLGRVVSEAAKATLYKGIANIYDTQGNSRLRAVALQKVLQFTPRDEDILFSAAYAQSDAQMPILSAVNYHTLLRFTPQHQSALNNLGVACEKLDLPMRCVSYYRKAVESKETLAMANLAYRYMNQGFKKEAQDILNKAMHEESPHKNVGEALAALADQREKEGKEWESLTRVVPKHQQFLWDFAEARFEPMDAVASFAGEWLASDGQAITITQEGQRISGKWEEKNSGEEIQGVIHGRALDVQYKHKFQTIAQLDGFWSDAEDGLGFLMRDQRVIRIQVLNEKHVRYITLTRQGETKRTAQDGHPTTESNAT